MNLAIFDIDGTLVDTNVVDGKCFVRALELEFGIPRIEMDWSRYDNPTDSGIAQAVFLKEFRRPPNDLEINRLRTRFLGLLRVAHSSNPNLFREIPGAKSFVELLLRHSEWKVAIATGGWYETAIFKLTCAGFSVHNVPMSTCDQAIDRESILRRCIEDAHRCYQANHFSKIVVIGDSSWDVKSARSLGLGFVGIGKPQQLSNLGVTHVVNNYADPVRLIGILELAVVPKSSKDLE